ncbi:MAG: hypothetical protein JWN63_473 [Candidatus Acidoferrum typicum]|nr:hypothetical protein [Candidatus Acidoferrum typicum]
MLFPQLFALKMIHFDGGLALPLTTEIPFSHYATSYSCALFCTLFALAQDSTLLFSGVSALFAKILPRSGYPSK